MVQASKGRTPTLSGARPPSKRCINRFRSSLAYFCRKWREGGPIQFWKEAWMRDAEQDLMVV